MFAAECSLPLQESLFSEVPPLLEGAESADMLARIFATGFTPRLVVKLKQSAGAAGTPSAGFDSEPSYKHARFQALRLLPFRMSWTCPGKGSICWVTVWEHMWLGSLAPSQTIKSAG